jgi:phosphate starvation-inducible protein PhoH
MENKWKAKHTLSPVSCEGKHWFVIFKSSHNLTEVFNSLGTTASFVSEQLNFKTVYEFNTTQVQGDQSILCGEFCEFKMAH